MMANDNFWGGLLLIIVSGLISGSFALPMKFSRSWKWENTWFLYSTLAFLLLPWLTVWIAVPRLFFFVKSLEAGDVLPSFFFGFLWGIAQVGFGLGIARVGMAVAFAIVIGLCAVFGSFIPLAILHPRDLWSLRGFVLLTSALILAQGLTLYARAGRQRELDQNPAGGTSDTGQFRTGLWICLFTGILGALLNVGFALSGHISDRAIAAGASPIRATYAVWTILLTAGYLPNLMYTVWLIWQNQSRSAFQIQALRESLLALVMAVCWLGGMFLYGIGATITGRFGTSIGYAISVTALILWSSLLGILTGEWRGAQSSTFKRMQWGLAIVLAALFVASSTGLL
jgi:L-rhamnose-H+ transport protein